MTFSIQKYFKIDKFLNDKCIENAEHIIWD